VEEGVHVEDSVVKTEILADIEVVTEEVIEGAIVEDGKIEASEKTGKIEVNGVEVTEVEEEGAMEDQIMT